MARPAGKRLNPHALRDVLALRGWTMTAGAAASGVPLTTLSGLANGDHRAGPRTVKALAEGLGCAPETLFPELAFRDVLKAAS